MIYHTILEYHILDYQAPYLFTWSLGGPLWETETHQQLRLRDLLSALALPRKLCSASGGFAVLLYGSRAVGVVIAYFRDRAMDLLIDIYIYICVYTRDPNRLSMPLLELYLWLYDAIVLEWEYGANASGNCVAGLPRSDQACFLTGPQCWGLLVGRDTFGNSA